MGSGFVVGGTTVTVGGVTVPADVQAPAAGLARASAVVGQVLQLTVPTGAAVGPSDLTVTTDVGSAVAAGAFTVDAVEGTTSSTTSTSTAPATTIPAPVTVSPATTSSGTLPYTGADSRGPLLIGLALVLGGGAVLIVRRRLHA